MRPFFLSWIIYVFSSHLRLLCCSSHLIYSVFFHPSISLVLLRIISLSIFPYLFGLRVQTISTDFPLLLLLLVLPSYSSQDVSFIFYFSLYLSQLCHFFALISFFLWFFVITHVSGPHVNTGTAIFVGLFFYI